MQGEEGERSNGWDAATDGRSNGWPLGLQRLSTTTSSHFLISTPSRTTSSSSSSGFDTESTVSFFPEKSTTLGSLIGIQSSSESVQSQYLIEDEKSTNKNTSGNSRICSWWPLLGCRGGLQEDPLKVSPSLAHLLEEERRDGVSQRQATSNSVGEHNGNEVTEQVEPDIDETASYSDTLYVNSATIPSRPSLRLILQQPSPTSTYPSTDWNMCGEISHHEHYRGDTSQGRSHAFWPNFCGKLSTSLTS